MTLDNEQDVVAIREWMAKESYLPNDLEDLMIKKFLHSCYGSLEKTKKCIEKFCCGRYNMPELYTCRDPASEKLKYAFEIGHVTTFPGGENEILMYLLDNPTFEKFDFYDLLKTFSIQSDYWIKVYESLPQGHIIVFDIKYVTLKLVTKVNIFYLQKFFMFLLEAMPIRLKQVHVINCPSYYDKLYALVKNALPQEIKDLICFHTTLESLQSAIDKKHLPEEYGGEAPSLRQQQKDWVKILQENRKMYTNDNMWKADVTKKPKNGAEEVMNGSFRTLSID